MADPLNLLTENKQQDPLGLLATTPESQAVSDPLTSSTDTDAIMPSWVDDAMKGVEAGFRMAPFKLGESLLGALDTIDQYNPFGGGARQIARTLTEGVADIKLPKEIRPARDASLYLRDLANQQAPKFGEGTAGYYAQSAVSSILSNVPSIVLGFATGSQLIGLLGMAAQVAEDKYNERILAGDSEEKARFGAGLYGAAEALGEKIPLGILMKNKGIRAILLSSLTEIPSEIATTIIQNGIDIGIYDETMSFADWKRSLADTAIITGVSAPFTAALGRGLGVGTQKILQKRQANMVKPVIQSEPIVTSGTEGGEAITPDIQMKGQKVTASIDGKQVGSYDGKKMSISPQYEGNRYAIASALLEAHKSAVESIKSVERQEVMPVVMEERHRPMTVEQGASRLDDLTPSFGEDIYNKNALQYFGTGQDNIDIKTINILQSLRGQPEADVTVYRAIPKDESITLLTSGDWVTINKQYAKEHGENILNGDYKIIEQTVKAKDLTTNPDSFHEQGYYPQETGIEEQKLKTSQQKTATISSIPNPSRSPGGGEQKASQPYEDFISQVSQSHPTTNIEGYLDRDTGKLIGDIQTADLSTLNALAAAISAEVTTDKKTMRDYDNYISLERVKSVIRERTGQTRVDNLVKEMDALEFAYETAQKASRDAYRQGDRAGALREHERMTLIQQLKKTRTDMNRETKATFKYLDSVNKKLDTMRIGDEYRDAIRSVLSYDADALETFSLRQLEKNDLVFIPEDMIEKLRETERGGITLDQLRNQKDIVKTLLYQARALNKIDVLNEKVAFKETVETIVNEIGQAWEIDASTLLQRLTPTELEKQARLGYKGVSRFQKIRETVRGLMSLPKKAEYIIEKAVNASRDSMLYKTTFQRTVEAERVEILRERGISAKLKEAVELIAADLKNIIRTEYAVEGVSNPITKQKAIMIALNSGNEQNRAAVKAGYGLTDANIDAITASLNDKETEFVLKIWNLLNDQFEAINEQYKKLTGLPMPKVDGQYFPLKYDTSVPQTTYVSEQQSKQDLFRTYSEVLSVFRGFTKERVKQSKYPPLLDFSVIVRHLADVNHFIAWGVPVRDINRILTNPMVKEALIQSIGEEQYSQLRPWLKGIANDHFDTLKYADTVMGKLLNNSSVAILGYALSTTVLQPTAILQTVNYKYEDASGTMRKIGVNEIVQGVVDFYKSYGENADLIYSLSPFMQERTSNMDFNIRQALEADTKHPFDERNFRRAAFAMMGFMDKLTTMPVWWTAYNIEMKESGDIQRAVDFADKVARNTQGSGAAKDLSEIQRGGNVRRAFTMFMTFFNGTYNEWGKTKDLVRGERVGSLEYAKTFMWICLLPAMIQAIFRYRDDLLEDTVEKIGKETIGYGFGSIPIVGSFVNALIGKYEFRPTPAVSLPTELIKITYSKDVPSFLKHGVAATGYLTGLPSRQMLLTGEYLFNLMEGGDADPLDMIYKKPKK